MPPKGVVCYICGREFSYASLGVHQPQCLKKWEVENNKLPPNQRRPVPIKPTILPNINGNGNQQYEMDRFNQAAYESAESAKSSYSGAGSSSGGGGGPPTKPVSVVCYICGREFGTKSIDIHEPQCIKKWEIENNKLPRELRRPRPKKPENMDSGNMTREEMNEAAWEASKAQLLPCENCGRRFAADRLPVHLRSCKPKPGQQSSNQDSFGDKRGPSKAPMPPKEPVYIICYICGRKYGSQSIEIHEPQCLEKWKIENNNLPKHLRRPIPVKPAGVPLSSSGAYDMEAMNEAAFQASKLQLLECENCGRRFQPDRLGVHQRSCKPGNVAKRIGAAQPSRPGGLDEEYDEEYQPLQTQAQTRQQPQIHQIKSNPAANGSSVAPMKKATQIGVANVDSLPIKKPASNNPAAIYNNAQDPTASGGGSSNLWPCPECGRKFASDRLQVHVATHNKEKKRKVFDSTKHRVQGTEAESFVLSKKKKPETKVRPNNWKQKHEEFIAAIRYAKMAGKIEKEGGSVADLLPPPPVATNPDYIQCPYCQRRFNQTAGERHIKSCKNTMNKPKPPPNLRGNSNQPNNGNNLIGVRKPVTLQKGRGF